MTVRVEVHARDVEQAALTSLLLDLDLSTPPTARTAFQPPADARTAIVDTPDLAADAARYSPFRLPPTLAGLSRRQDVGARSGVATYGAGLTALTVIPLRGRTAARLLRSLEGDDVRADEAQISTALVQGRVARQGRRGYLLLGTVPQDVLTTALTALRRDPPPERFE